MAVGSTAGTSCWGAAATKYTITYVGGTITVVQASQTPITPTPVISLASGTYSSVQNVSLSDAAIGAIIYYTIDGTNPTTSSSVYEGPISIGSSMTLK